MDNSTENNDQPEAHPNRENEIGSLNNTTGKHGADRQLKGNDDGISKSEDNNEMVHTPSEKPENDQRDKSQSYNGTNDPDSNHTPHPEKCDQ